MISCFRGGLSSGRWENGIQNSNAAYNSNTSSATETIPKISRIIESLRQYDVFKYSAYRTAFKLRTIQKISKLHLIDLSLVNATLERFEGNRCSMERTITSSEAESIICSIYTEAEKKIGITEEPNILALLFLAFLQNTFVESEKPLLFLHLKIALTLFSSAKLSEKYKQLFLHCADGNLISKQNLQILFVCLSKIAEIVGEQVTFGVHLVPVAVKNLWKFSKGNVTLKRFHKWLMLEPQTLVWISTLHRISTSETTEHFVTCDFCRASSIRGLRYRCLQCINYNLCQNCFLCGHSNKHHKEKHPVQEFCHRATAWDKTKAVVNVIKNKLPFVPRCPAKTYLSFDDESLCESMKDITKKGALSNSIIYNTIKKNTTAYIIKELSSVIKQLEGDKKQISAVVENFNKENESTDKPLISNLSEKSLQAYNTNLETQLSKLKQLLQTLQSPRSKPKRVEQFVSPVPHVPFSKKEDFFESTPLNNPLSEHSNDYPEKLRNFQSSVSLDVFMRDTESTSDNQSSLDLSKFLNDSHPTPCFDDSKISPIYAYSISEMDNSLIMKTKGSSLGKAVSVPALHHPQEIAPLSRDFSLEAMELELQAMLQHIQQLLPEVSDLSNGSTVQKEKLASALSHMENKLSHLSLTLSFGSTEL